MKFTPGRTVFFTESVRNMAANTPDADQFKYTVDVTKGTLATVIHEVRGDGSTPFPVWIHKGPCLLVYAWNRHVARYILALASHLELADFQPPEDVRLAFEACIMADEPRAALSVLERSEQPRGGCE
jgi:hypothetical protein